MASKEFHAMQEAMAARPVPPPPADIAEQRSRIAEAMAQLPLAEGTVAEPFVRSGVPGIECRPVDVADDAPIVLPSTSSPKRSTIASPFGNRSLPKESTPAAL